MLSDNDEILGYREVVSVKITDEVTIMVEATPLNEEVDVNIVDEFDFSEVTDAIEAIATSMTTSFNKIKPKKATVEFGLEIGVNSGKLTTLLVKSCSRTNLKITLEWEN
ncbi:CU044_2847 family protein [Gloeothece verrucosa]|uniref:Trypsin-co-occurring domain-containing protein n=1 Tax=Gloeothece verrucosa (strain PCC 7822) TaxID=497965 RepID=E0U5R7_GLOV7|nr:CU044_2847 family protein [Gloeothece verrucosa]ADN15908.1 conserved hypothetical protein [Gloeothece verrucosa PCC 7822]